MTHLSEDKNHHYIPTCWIITEGLAGTENQCIGVAEKLQIPYEIKRIHLNQPWKLLSPYLKGECHATFQPSIEPPWPDILIASGRKSIAAVRYIKKHNKSKTFTVQIQDPRINPAQFDLVAVPAHDPTRGENVIVTTATPNKITADQLETARKRFELVLAPLPAPRIAVMIGGSTKNSKVPPEAFDRITNDLLRLSEQYSLMVTTSRRTGEKNFKSLQSKLQKENIYFYDQASPNPYMAMLGWADAIIITNDSTSMISEAATTGKPAYVYPFVALSKRQAQLVENLKSYGAVKDFSGTIDHWTYPPLDDAGQIARVIREKSGFFEN